MAVLIRVSRSDGSSTPSRSNALVRRRTERRGPAPFRARGRAFVELPQIEKGLRVNRHKRILALQFFDLFDGGLPALVDFGAEVLRERRLRLLGTPRRCRSWMPSVRRTVLRPRHIAFSRRSANTPARQLTSQKMVERRIRDSLVRLEIISAERRVVLVPLSEHHIKALGIIRDREDYSGSPRCEWYILAAHRNFLGSESINLGANFLPPRTI